MRILLRIDRSRRIASIALRCRPLRVRCTLFRACIVLVFATRQHRHGMAWHGMAWHGMAWHGMAGHGRAGQGRAGQGRRRGLSTRNPRPQRSRDGVDRRIPSIHGAVGERINAGCCSVDGCTVVLIRRELSGLQARAVAISAHARQCRLACLTHVTAAADS